LGEWGLGQKGKRSRRKGKGMWRAKREKNLKIKNKKGRNIVE